MHGTRGNPKVLKAGFILFSLAISAVGFQTSQQPGGNKDIQIMALTFGCCQLFFELIVLPLLTRSMARKRAYNGADMLIHLAIHENGVLLGFVLSFISHDPRYLYYFSFPCILLMILTPVGNPIDGPGNPGSRTAGLQ